MAGMQNYVDPILNVNRALDVFIKDELLVDRKMFASFRAEKINQLRGQVQQLSLMAGALIPMLSWNLIHGWM